MSNFNNVLQGKTIYDIFSDPVGRPGRETRSGDFVGKPPQVRNIRDTRGAGPTRVYKSLRFQTYGHLEFKFYYDLFYPVDENTGLRRWAKPA